MKEKLQSIIDGETTGSDAISVLRLALKEYKSMVDKSTGLSQLISQAEDYLLYGKEGRGINKTFR
jgi:hypothetical protein